ncbi:MAG: hypothetical protein IJM84_05590, partial [Bacteroidaceae bacterium]|nr:hypothetical protein [Bacteroidaceae bacterium]
NNNKGSNKGLIAILIAVGVALLGIIILLILLLTRDNTVSTTPTETPVTQTDSTATTVEEEAPHAEEAAAPVYKPSFQEGGTFSFSGSISGAGGIRMTLTNNGGDVSGSYYYTRYGKPLYLSGSCYGNHMTLYGDHEIWEGTVTGSSYSGTMTNTNTDRSFRFRTKY